VSAGRRQRAESNAQQVCDVCLRVYVHARHHARREFKGWNGVCLCLCLCLPLCLRDCVDMSLELSVSVSVSEPVSVSVSVSVH